jgi:2-keto-4-pentenoate hydratase/2-oxohepta-3-ene-1,7-dioic acid hydratase in catechol pathway
MKLVTFAVSDGTQHIGALIDDGRNITILAQGETAMDGRASSFYTDMPAFLHGGVAARERAQAVLEFITRECPPATTIPLQSVTLLSPVPIPASIRDSMGFEQHIINAIRVVGFKRLAFLDEWVEKVFGRERSLAYLLNRTWYDRPIYYKGNCRSVIGTNADVRIPPYTQKFDYELEFGIYIGRQGVNIPREKARDYIGGYTIFNDFSARDIQLKEQGGRLGPAKGKDFDTGNAMGPYLVTPDEISDPYQLTMTARINGEEWSRGTSADMHYKFEDLIAYISKSETLYPGDFIGSGTCSGGGCRGCGLELNRFLKPGDIVELEVQGLGVLRNRIVS